MPWPNIPDDGRPKAPGGRTLARRTLLLCALAALLACGHGVRAEDQPALEIQVKAAFLTRFPKFIEWPAGTFTNAAASIVIGILGEDPFGELLPVNVLPAEGDRQRPLRFRRLKNLNQSDGFHILFVCSSERHRLSSILPQLSGRPVLTVGDHDGFAKEGGIINFIKEKGRVRFEINVSAARRAGLRISSKLLQVSTVIQSEKVAESP
jgi:hypothetical protein